MPHSFNAIFYHGDLRNSLDKVHLFVRLPTKVSLLNKLDLLSSLGTFVLDVNDMVGFVAQRLIFSESNALRRDR